MEDVMDAKTKVVAEISIHRVGSSWFAWALFAPGRPSNERAGSSPSPTEALWRAIDNLRDDDELSPPSGQIAVLSHDGHRIAYAPVWAVPQYEHLQWRSVAEEILLGISENTTH